MKLIPKPLYCLLTGVLASFDHNIGHGISKASQCLSTAL